MAVCLERGADLHTTQLMPLPLTVSCFSKIQIGLPFLVPAHLGSPGKRAVKRVCVCVGDVDTSCSAGSKPVGQVITRRSSATTTTCPRRRCHHPGTCLPATDRYTAPVTTVGSTAAAAAAAGITASSSRITAGCHERRLLHGG